MAIQDQFQLAAKNYREGNLADAQTLCRQILREQPDEPNSLNLLGVMAHQVGRNDMAAQLLGRATTLAPRVAGYHFNLGLALGSLGQWQQAAASYAHAAALEPAKPEHHYSAGVALMNIGQWPTAAAAFQQALSLRPQDGRAANNLGLALHATGRLDESIAAYQRAVAADPNEVTPVYNLGNVYQDRGDYQQAIDCFQTALRLKPDLAEAHSSMGNALSQIGRIDESIAACRAAVALNPQSAELHGNLGQMLLMPGRLDEAIDEQTRAAELKPDHAGIASNRLFAIQFSPRFDAKAILHEHRLYDQRHAQPLAALIQPFENAAGANRRLRIGYVSPDFRRHCQAVFTMPLLGAHDHEQFEIFCYSSVARPDAVTERLRGYADVWRTTVTLDDQRLAELIRTDRIDILVDLTMHMCKGRPLLFARKPAPVQAAWLAYPGTTGLSAMDYRLTDPYLDPPGIGDDYYSEKSLRLPDTFWCYEAQPETDDSLPPPAPLPAEKNRYITFGCLNSFWKVNAATFSLWSRVLAGVERSKLRLLAPDGEARQRVLKTLAHNAIEPGRVEFVARQSRSDYLAEFQRIDICLDTLPYNGHTTSLDSMWMGTPVVSRIGSTVVGRAGWSQLSNLNLAELAGADDDQFVKIAVELAADLPRLAELRRTLQSRMADSPLCDPNRFARGMESAYRRMWTAPRGVS